MPKVYEGREAQVHVNDIEMLRHIMVKDYDHFAARRQLEFGDPVLNEIPDFLKGTCMRTHFPLELRTCC